MNAQAYLKEELEKCSHYELAENDKLVLEKEGIQAFIFKKITSKKFRKYAAKPELIEHIKTAIKLNVEKNQPINVTFMNGAYKLWRLEESPEADWAELFAYIYYINWLKPICAVYKPGVWFDSFVDDLIVPKINNIPLSDVESYRKSCQAILDFLKQYQPENMRMTMTSVGDQFDSPEAYDKKLQEDIKRLAATLPNGLPKLTEAKIASIDLNVKLTPDQDKDPLWRQKVALMHDTHILYTKAETGYHLNRPDKILAFTQPLPSGIALAVGTTKTSIVKFWVGVGVLKKEEDSYKQYVFSPKQLETNTFTKENIAIEGLNGKNFKTIRVAADTQ